MAMQTKVSRFFSNLLEKSLEEPDAVTFLGAISACKYIGRVDEGRRYFEMMQTN
jgi:hypothetical protein